MSVTLCYLHTYFGNESANESTPAVMKRIQYTNYWLRRLIRAKELLRKSDLSASALRLPSTGRCRRTGIEKCLLGTIRWINNVRFAAAEGRRRVNKAASATAIVERKRHRCCSGVIKRKCESAVRTLRQCHSQSSRSSMSFRSAMPEMRITTRSRVPEKPSCACAVEAFAADETTHVDAMKRRFKTSQSKWSTANSPRG